MILCATLALSLAVPQLSVDPYHAQVGQEVVVKAGLEGEPLAGVEITLESPDGRRRSAGVTDAGGNVRIKVEMPGEHHLSAVAGEVRMVTLFQAEAARPRWLLATACVPLGLALLWRNLSRARDRRVR